MHNTPHFDPLAVLLASQQVIEVIAMSGGQKSLAQDADLGSVDHGRKIARAGDPAHLHEIAGACLTGRTGCVKVDTESGVLKEGHPELGKVIGYDSAQVNGIPPPSLLSREPPYLSHLSDDR
jgi:hypothetical protein